MVDPSWIWERPCAGGDGDERGACDAMSRFEKAVERVLMRDPRYPREAYVFLRDLQAADETPPAASAA